MGEAGFPPEMRPRCPDVYKTLDVKRFSKCLQGTSPGIKCEGFERIYSLLIADPRQILRQGSGKSRPHRIRNPPSAPASLGTCGRL
jgi:hypothetical protein